MPWEWVWKELASDYQFWHKEITEPCMLYLSNIELDPAPGQRCASEQAGSGHRRYIDIIDAGAAEASFRYRPSSKATTWP